MKIASYETGVVEAPYGKDRTWTHLTLRIRTDDGLEGISYISRTRGPAIKATLAVMEGLLDELQGQNPLNTEALGAVLFRRNVVPGYERAASAIDTALWDLKGKALGQPVFRLLGGFRDRVPTYASWNVEPRADLDSLVKDCAAHVDAGFRAMKVHLRGLTLPRCLEHVRVMRETVGEDVEIMLDINQTWDAKQAVRWARQLEQYHPYWLEEPVSMEDYDSLRYVKESLETPTCGGEVYRSIAQFKRLIAAGAIDIVMVDLDLGITGFMKVAHLAEAFGLPVVPHLATEHLAHCIAAVPNGLTVEYYPWAEWLFHEVPTLDAAGNLALFDRPGFGLEFDEDALRKFKVG